MESVISTYVWVGIHKYYRSWLGSPSGEDVERLRRQDDAHRAVQKHLERTWDVSKQYGARPLLFLIPVNPDL